MNFEIQKRTFQQLQRDAHDALVVIWPQDAAAGQGPLSAWVNKAIKAGDFEHKTGSILQSYGMDGVKARRVLVVSCGEGKTADHKAAVTAAWASLKGAKVQRLGLHWAGDVQPEQVQHAVVTLAEASYTYTTNAYKFDTDLGSATAPSSGSAGQAGEVFGQLMAKALQQQGKGQRHGHELTEEAPATNAQETAQAAALASETDPATDASGEGEPGDALATGLASGHSDDALAQFNALWMPGMSQTFTLPASAGVKSVNVGPSIQVITASNPAPDANSLTAFAHQQGLDAQAIAWLMNPRAQATATAAAATTVPGSTASGLPTAGASPGMAPATLPGLTPAATSATSAASEAAGTALTSGMTPATSAEWGTTVSAAATTPATTAPATAMASTLPATGPAGPAQTATGLPDLLHPASDAKAAALAAAVPVVQAILSGPASRAAVPNSPSPHQPTAPELSELSAMTMAQLRWGGVKPRGIGQADNSTPAPATSTATPTLWAQSDLDLSGLDLGLLAQDGNTSGQDSPAPTASSSSASKASAPQASPTPRRGCRCSGPSRAAASWRAA